MEKRLSILAVFVATLCLLLTSTTHLQQTIAEPADVPVLLAPADTVLRIALDSTRVYFTEHYLGNVKRVPIDGGPVDLLVSGENTPYGIAVDSDYVYYIAHNAGRIMKISKSGGTAITLVSGLYDPWDIAVDTDYVYFSECPADGHIKRVPKDGGAIELLAEANRPEGIAIDSDYLYFVERDLGNVKKTPLGGGDVQIVASGLIPRLHYITVDSDYVYFVETNFAEPLKGRVSKVPKEGGDITILATDQYHPLCVAVDSHDVYFTESNAGNVKRVSKDGGAVETLASGFNRPEGIAVNSHHVYFSDYEGVYKLGLPSLAATIDIDPNTLNLKSNGQWITAYITLPEDYSVEDIVVSTVELMYSGFVNSTSWGEVQDPVLMVKFDRAALRDYLGEVDVEDGDRFYEVTLTVKGELLDGMQFKGTDTITVKNK